MNRPDKLASVIASLTDDEIGHHSFASLAFAEQHTFEHAFTKRTEHLKSLVRAEFAVRSMSIPAGTQVEALVPDLGSYEAPEPAREPRLYPTKSLKAFSRVPRSRPVW